MQNEILFDNANESLALQTIDLDAMAYVTGGASYADWGEWIGGTAGGMAGTWISRRFPPPARKWIVGGATVAGSAAGHYIGAGLDYLTGGGKDQPQSQPQPAS
jgi:hypothetical protein